MNDDITSIADGVQPISLRRPGSDFETKIPRALLRPYHRHRQFAVQERIVPTAYAHCYIAMDSIPSSPLEGDELEDSEGTVWFVVEVNLSGLNSTWQCVAKSYSVRFELEEHVDLLATAYTKTSVGVLERGFRITKTGIAAKFAKRTVELGDQHKESFYVLIRERIDFNDKDVLRRTDGSILEIEKVNYPLRENDWTEILVNSE